MPGDLQSCANAASRLTDLLANPPPDRDFAAKKILKALAILYAEALDLPWPSQVSGELRLQNQYPVDDAQCRKISANVAAVFGDHRFYWLQFDPVHPRDGSDAPVMGDLAGDLSEIWADVVPGLTAWQEGREDLFDEILWDWHAVNFQTHWGVHAAHALHAMHTIVFLHGVGPLSDTQTE